MGLAFIRVIQIGIKSLMLHKMRSLLTMMGIIFGVCSVIAMLAIGEGASSAAQFASPVCGAKSFGTACGGTSSKCPSGLGP